MFKKIFICITVLSMFMVASCCPANAEDSQGSGTVVSIDLSMLSSEKASQVLTAMKAAEEQKKQQAETEAKTAPVVGKEALTSMIDAAKSFDPDIIATFADRCAEFITKVAAAFGMSANQFLDTKAGWLVVAVAIWFMGGPFLVSAVTGFIVGGAFWTFSTIVFTYWYYYMFMARDVVTAESGEGKKTVYTYTPRVDLSGTERMWTMIVGVVIYLCIAALCGGAMIP